MRITARVALAVAVVCVAHCGALAGQAAKLADALPKYAVTDYDDAIYWVKKLTKRPYHGNLQPWVFNRAMVWLDDGGAKGTVICYSGQSPLLLTGAKGVSRWYAGDVNEVANGGDEHTRLVKKDPAFRTDHACLPAFQFAIEQHPQAELEVAEATHPWQFLVAIKGRSGPPLYASEWKTGAGKVMVDLRKLYRAKGYTHQFPELHFFVATWTKGPKEQAVVRYRLRLVGGEAIIPSLPVIRTVQRARAEGVPVCAVVLDGQAKRLGADAVGVSADVGGRRIELAAAADGVWRAVVKGLPLGEHKATLVARWKTGARPTLRNTIDIQVTDGQFVGYDAKLKLLTRGGKVLGPLTGSYQGEIPYMHVSTPRERRIKGDADWKAHVAEKTKADGYHFWESLTEAELDDNYKFVAACGWTVVHICQHWSWWERLDAGGRIAPHGAEQLASVLKAAARHGVYIHFALSHYPYGKAGGTVPAFPPYAQYLEAGYSHAQLAKHYRDPKSKFMGMFLAHLSHFATVFKDHTQLSGLTASGEGDRTCGKAFVNAVHDFMQAHDGNHLFLCEPFNRMNQDPNYYRKAGWKPVLGGMRTYGYDSGPVENVAVKFKLCALGDLFMAEGCWCPAPKYCAAAGMGSPMGSQGYRLRVRRAFYTGLAHHSPVTMSWEERVCEDERVVFEQVRRTIDWSEPFQTPRLIIRVHPQHMKQSGRTPLVRYQRVLSRLPLASAYVWEKDPAPAGSLHVIDAAAPFEEPTFASGGGRLPDALKSDMPLRLPKGYAADYSWSASRRQLIAYVHGRGDGPARTGPRPDSHREGGATTYVDTTLAFDRDTTVDTWEAACDRPGDIQLRIYRREGDELALVGQSTMERMSQRGTCRFALERPIAARKGDFVGCYMPKTEASIGARPGGHMLYRLGDEPRARSPFKAWKSERKIAEIEAYNAAEARKRKAVAEAAASLAAPAGQIVLQHFPEAKLRYRLYDLESKRAVREGDFERRATVPIGHAGDHLFLVVVPGR